MSETLIDDEETLLKTFTCDCYAIEHGLGVMLEKEVNEVIFNWYVTPFTLRDKLKHIWDILTGQGVYYHEFLLRKEDVSELIDLLKQAKEVKK